MRHVQRGGSRAIRRLTRVQGSEERWRSSVKKEKFHSSAEQRTGPPREPTAASRTSQAAAASPQRSMLLREYIADCLYARTTSYFAEGAPVSSLPTSLPFRAMWGFWSYRNHLYRVFQDADGFMTPVEIFKPYYAHAIARYIVECLQESRLYVPHVEESDAFQSDSATSVIQLVEIGAGNGTCAVGILDYLQEHHPLLYNRIEYEIVDVSKAFVARQRETLARHASRVRIINQSVYDYNGSSRAPGFVIGLEILDNLPHDKLIVDSLGHIRQTHVEERVHPQDSSQSVFTEKHTPLQDPLILDYLRTYARHFGLDTSWIGDASLYSDNSKIVPGLILWHYLRHPSVESIRRAELHASSSLGARISAWIRSYLTPKAFKSTLSRFGAATGGVTPERIMHLPTGSFAFLQKLYRQHPTKQFILSDFDYLPEAMPGINAPLVQRSEGNVTRTYASYLDAPAGHCDIFYPTNFDSLRVMFHEISGGAHAQTVRSKQFLKRYAHWRATRTRTGYNPLLQDFINTQFFLSGRPDDDQTQHNHGRRDSA